MKIVLGSAQFGVKYGILSNKKLGKKEFPKIEKKIFRSNIKFIDTSSNYIDSEKYIGLSKLRSLNIITKIKLSTNKKDSIKKSVNSTISRSLKRLNCKNLYGVLIHDYTDLLGANGKEFLNELKLLKKNRIIKNIGISIYSPNELNVIWKFWKPDLIQAPFNIFDQRILKTGWIDKLKKNHVKIFVRSSFLQGILVGNYRALKIPKKFKLYVKKFDKWCLENNITRLKACLDFVKQFKKIDFIVVGFNNYEQLDQIISNFNKKGTIVPKKFITNNLNVIDPRRWK
tara:strand:+ start:809 stop:1663 length:855 start_codon:yes stop_codon:yes gene_type:complete